MFTAVLIDFGFRKIWTHLYLKYKYGRNQKKHIKILILVTFDQVLWMNVLSTFKIFLYFSIFNTIKKKSTSCHITRKNPSIWKMFCCGNQFLLLIGKQLILWRVSCWSSQRVIQDDNTGGSRAPLFLLTHWMHGYAWSSFFWKRPRNELRDCYTADNWEEHVGKAKTHACQEPHYQQSTISLGGNSDFQLLSEEWRVWTPHPEPQLKGWNGLPKHLTLKACRACVPGTHKTRANKEAILFCCCLFFRYSWFTMFWFLL